MCCRRQAGHQQAAGAPGTGTTAGSALHQHGAAAPPAIAQANVAPQPVQVLMRPPGRRGVSAWESYRPTVAQQELKYNKIAL
ncbi:hypothetical protein [Massilia sp. TWR1-2-2]|uniref:hypothetical protein n=1 Tax=Massilia sp. TWR1-2-2 TaxID=2804584 RepID=UPI003CF7744C